MVKFILIKSPDEWATTKQACRDEIVVYLSFSSIYTTLYFYVLSTVLRKSSFTLYIYIHIYIYIYIYIYICFLCVVFPYFPLRDIFIENALFSHL